MKKILAAESVKTFIDECKGVLSRKEFAVISSPTAEGILSAHEADKADLIIVDLDTPEMGGEALSFLLRRKDDLKAVSIVVVCDGSEKSRERAISCGANAVVAKPLDPETLSMKIKELLHIRERKSIREIVKVSVKVNSAGDFFFAVSKNLSTSGLLVETNRALAAGDIVTCSLVLQHPVAVQGEIIRIAKECGDAGETLEYGIKFRGLDQAAEAEIKEYVRNLEGK